ncbi:mobilization protein MobC [Klebsiella michiganensis]|uniref:mobilization protein MobC n=1 Tax=Klebsiella michiganensis TaxID=1134687 RepID=UPI003F50CBB6
MDGIGRTDFAMMMALTMQKGKVRMAANTFYTKEQIEEARLQLAELPDLTQTRLTGKDVLESLKAQIVELSVRKGYSAKDIKSALESCQIQVSERAIKEALSSQKNTRKKGSATTKIKMPATQESTNTTQK